jgi:hypothetical protein
MLSRKTKNPPVGGLLFLTAKPESISKHTATSAHLGMVMMVEGMPHEESG